MTVYKIPIEFAFIVFPFIAFILTIPFLIHQYRKYGAIPMLKSACFYSLILYLICAYFLVMLPLPSIESVTNMTGPKTQLTLFQFIKDIMSTTNYEVNNLNTLIRFLKQPTVYTVIFNIVLTLPLGVYLRYYFQKKWYHTLFYSLLLSLFFELTQLSGLYGIYPRPYRLFDVDDLLINSLGGLVGHMITPIFTMFLPTRDELEAKSYQKGERVTLLRRGVSFMIDIFFLSIFCLITKILTYNTIFSDYYALITLIMYYIVIPCFVSGKTLGKKVVRLKLTGLKGNIKWYQVLIRNSILVFLTIYPFVWISILEKNINSDIISTLWIVIVIYQIVNVLYYIKTLRNKTHLFLYEKLTMSKNMSTIENIYGQSKELATEETVEASEETEELKIKEENKEKQDYQQKRKCKQAKNNKNKTG